MFFVLNEGYLFIIRESFWILLSLRFKRLMVVSLYKVFGIFGRLFFDKFMFKSLVFILF